MLSTLLIVFSASRFVLTLIALVCCFMRGIPLNKHRLRTALLPCTAIALGLIAFNTWVILGAYTHTRSTTATFLLIGLWINATFLFALLIARSCWNISWTNAISRWLLAVCVERFVTACIHNILFAIIVPTFKADHPVYYMMITVFLYSTIITVCALWGSRWFPYPLTMQPAEDKRLLLLIVACFGVLFAVTQSAMRISEGYVSELHTLLPHEIAQHIVVFSTMIAGVVAIVILLLQYALYYTAHLRHNTAVRTVIAEHHAQQYAQLQDNMDVITEQAHNLKHILSALEVAPIPRHADLIEQAKDAISAFDATAQTNNEALNVLFAERSLTCRRNNIRLTVMLKGCDFSSFDVVDMFTLFGNALDNAIEYVSQFDRAEERVIAINGSQQGNIITVSCDNVLKEPLTLHEGLPQTTKDQPMIHGIGLRSIRQIAQQYGGDIHIDATPPLFTLQISLLVP